MGFGGKACKCIQPVILLRSRYMTINEQRRFGLRPINKKLIKNFQTNGGSIWPRRLFLILRWSCGVRGHGSNSTRQVTLETLESCLPLALQHMVHIAVINFSECACQSLITFLSGFPKGCAVIPFACEDI